MRILKLSEFAKRVGYHPKTIQIFDRDGRFPAKKNSAGRRYYTEEDVLLFLQQFNPAFAELRDKPRKVVTYTRVSSSEQKVDLQSQQAFIETFVVSRGIAVDLHLSDVSSGLNYNRKNFLKLMDMVENDEVSELIVAHKDRLVRFGFEYFERLCQKHNTKLTVINLESCSPEEEFTQDLISIVHCFSSRLYGLRKYKKNTAQLSRDLKLDESVDTQSEE
ncbi:IS607 family transposase [Moraxella canis]|uniref:Resolvase/invertase-type recombinase catalytic domain-containing protein n=1 Tax=Moraxella canis TaxID=90239 RepID=A0A1S9ZPY5_9GAMM|nr:IS607 family transposase [Moraxella canis]OOR85428.1 hypothetical protein B0180_01155 [Moraxella canis]